VIKNLFLRKQLAFFQERRFSCDPFELPNFGSSKIFGPKPLLRAGRLRGRVPRSLVEQF